MLLLIAACLDPNPGPLCTNELHFYEQGTLTFDLQLLRNNAR